MRSAEVIGLMILAAAVCGCSSTGAAGDELATLAAKAEEEFATRGDGTFVDTGYAAYCRTGSGFDEGVFEQIGFAPAEKGFGYCYNVSSDRKMLALAATSVKDGSVRCLIIDATSGEPQRGEITDKSPCVP